MGRVNLFGKMNFLALLNFSFLFGPPQQVEVILETINA